ncbi:MAG TPA: 30S ribosomal protein S12 methylthiotransferase RimO [Oligoflexia bacterium]|nr:30S ribosomal protein S12 methylthiotransferase RimO [Oligoflexia bacterium]HMP49025.1 30S ribosomal protein S12 methylthiotransferase RimO [Oligoflexia bacterium]
MKPVLPVLSDNNSCDLAASHPVASSPVDARNFSGTVAFVTLGCSKNTVDSEVMMGVLSQKGYVPVEDISVADLIVVNTCAFLESAVKEGIDTILDVSRYKTEGRCRRLVVAGCMVERYRAELALSLPEVDMFISTDEILKVGDEDSTAGHTFDEARRPYFLYDDQAPRVLSTGSHTAYVKIAEGCNRPCAFCIIPKIRGSFRSRARDSVIRECSGLISQGVRELNLVAQDLTAYGTDFEGNRGIISELPGLLSGICEANRDLDFWLRLYYAYPIGLSEELLKMISCYPQICNYLDLPLQHISHAVLKRMQRPLGEKGTRALIDTIRSSSPELVLRTTFVVGFPGETDQDIRQLEDFIREGHFTHVGIFTYSQEKEAKAFSFDQQVDDEVKNERRDHLMGVQQEVLSKKLNSYVGKTQRVIFEGLHPESDMLYQARSEWQGPDADGIIIINDCEENFPASEMIGKFIEVEITDVAGYDLLGSVCGEA